MIPSHIDKNDMFDLSSAVEWNDYGEDEGADVDDTIPILDFDDDETFAIQNEDNGDDELDGRNIACALSKNSSSSPLTLGQLSEAFAANVSYFYLKNELGLSDTAMWRVTFEASSALGMTTATVRHKINVLREMMGLSDDDVRNIIERQPTILHLSADMNISPTMLYLLRALDLGRDDLRALIVACPALLCYSITNLKSKIGFFTRLMGYSVDECRELLLKQPNLLRASVSTGLVPRLQFLLGDVELPLDQLRLIVLKHPGIIIMSLDKNLVPKLVYYMIMKLQMNTAQLKKILLAYPRILDYNLDRNILPTTQYFVKGLDFSPAEFRNILLKFPRLFSHSLRKIKYAVGYFRFELGMSALQVKKVLYRAPTILGLNTDANIKGKVEFLRQSLRLTDSELQTVLAAMPSLLILSSDGNIQPKLDYLNQILHGDETTELRDAVVRLPTLLGYSFEKRIRPRVEAILEAGLDPSCITIGIPMKEQDFVVWLERRANKYRKGQTSDDDTVGTEAGTTYTATVGQSLSSNRIVHWSRERRPQPDS